MSEVSTPDEEHRFVPGKKTTGLMAATGSDLYRDLFLSSATPVLLFGCATLNITDLNDQARSLLHLCASAPPPDLATLLSFPDVAAWENFRSGEERGWVSLHAELEPEKEPLLLRLKRLPAPNDHLAQAILVPEAYPGSPFDTCDGVYSSICTHAGIGLTVIDPSMRVLSMNPTIRAWFPQIDPQQRPYCFMSFNSPPREAPCTYCPTVKVFQDGKVHSATTVTPTPAGVRHYSMIASPIFAPDGTVSAVIETAEDVTDRMLLEQQVAEKSRTLQAVLDHAPIAIWYKDTEGRFRFVNRTFCRQMGIDEADFLTAPHFSALLPPEMAASCAATDRECLEHDGPQVSLERFPFCDGRQHLLSVTKAKLMGDEGETLGVIGLGMDISEQQLIAQRLEGSQRRYRTLFSEAGEGVFMLSDQGVILEVNQSFADMHGYRVEEMTGMHLSELDTPESLAGAPDRIRRLLAGERLTFETEHYHKDGHTFPLEVSASAMDFDGELNIICFHRDITERKNQEAVLKNSEREFRLLADALPQMVWICSAAGENLYTNDKWVAYTGLSREESCGGGWRRAFHPEDLQKAMDAWLLAAQGMGEYTLEARLKEGDGEYRWWLVRGVPVHDDEGRILRWFGTCTDIDHLKKAEEERRVLEQQFQQAQKLESLGVLAGGVAHDFNNILAIISGYCSLLQIEPERLRDYLPEIEAAADRAAELCRQMLAYAGKTHFAMGLVELSVLMDEMVRMLRATLGHNVTICFDRPAEEFYLLGDAGRIRQVAMNLIINASEAIGEHRGEIRVALEQTEVLAGDGETDHLGQEIPPGKYACLEVADTGCGMDQETRRRVFEPFFSTKFSGRGLGMSAVLGIIKAHGGALQLDSGPGEGTRFRIYLPALEDCGAGSEQGAEAVQPVPWQGGGTVLLVEDEPMVRRVAAAMLKKMGFEVVEAGDGLEGLERYRQQEGGFRLVVTDLGMPLMDGYQMFHALKRLDPGLPIIVATGFGDLDVTSKIPRDQMAGFAAKPYRLVQFRDLVRRVVQEATHC